MAGKLRPPLALEARRLTMAGHRRRGGGGWETAPAHRGATHPPAGPTPATNPMGPSTQGQIILQHPLTHPEVPWKSHSPGNDCMMPSSAKTGSCNPSILLHSVPQHGVESRKEGSRTKLAFILQRSLVATLHNLSPFKCDPKLHKMTKTRPKSLRRIKITQECLS